MPFGSALTILLVAAVVGLVFFVLRRQALARQQTRAGYFQDVTRLFTDLRASRALSGFPRISGHYQGQEFDLQVVPDTLTLRKLPALWLLVTLPGPQPVRGSFDLMMRPTGVESFSNFSTLPNQIPPPRGFPTDCAIRADGVIAPWLLPFVARHLAGLDQNCLKEILITPKGLRLVWLIEEADRGRYLIFRDAEMGRTPLAAERLTPLLQTLLELQIEITSLASREAA